jgi:hypothetical protein
MTKQSDIYLKPSLVMVLVVLPSLFLEELVVVFIPRLPMLDQTSLVKLSKDLKKMILQTQVSLLTTSETMLVILLVWELIFLDHWLNLHVLH